MNNTYCTIFIITFIIYTKIKNIKKSTIISYSLQQSKFNTNNYKFK